MKLFKDIMTEDDGQTYCMARVCVFIGVLSFCAIGIAHVFKGIPIDFSQFGIGFGAILGGGGVLIGGKAATQKVK